MCLAIPGRVMEISGEPPINLKGKVSFGGAVREVNFAYVPDAKVGDYVLVHVGMALSRVDEDEAKKVFEYLSQMEEMMEEAQGAGSATEPTHPNLGPRHEDSAQGTSPFVETSGFAEASPDRSGDRQAPEIRS